jgi:hypothetical protein
VDSSSQSGFKTNHARPKWNFHRKDAEDAKKFFVWRGDTAKQKGFCSIIGRLTVGAVALKRFDLISEGTKILLQSPSPDWSRKKLPRRTLRLCGESYPLPFPTAP